MTTISEEQAVALAEGFLASKPVRRKCGQITAVRHQRGGAHEEAGTYCVEFAYAGPPVKKGAVPARNHPTVVLVNDRTGECKVMLWL